MTRSDDCPVNSVADYMSSNTLAMMIPPITTCVSIDGSIVGALPVNGIKPLDETFSEDEDDVTTGWRDWALKVDKMILPRTADIFEADGSGTLDESMKPLDAPRDIIFPFTTVADEPRVSLIPSPTTWPLPTKVKGFDAIVMAFVISDEIKCCGKVDESIMRSDGPNDMVFLPIIVADEPWASVTLSATIFPLRVT